MAEALASPSKPARSAAPRAKAATARATARSASAGATAVRPADSAAGSPAALPRPALLYLNAAGGPMRGGADDPAGNRAVAIGSSQQRVAVPPFGGGEAAWKDIVTCVRQGYAPFAVDVVTERPREQIYSMIVVGGSPRLTRNADNVGGYAPMGDGRDRQLVGFVFSEVLGDGKGGADVAKVCQGILHESGHLFGLDHVYACEDPMSYLSCGVQRFLETEEPCGEQEARACKYGEVTRPTQSSALRLAAHVGWREGRAPVAGAAPPAAHLALPIIGRLDEVVSSDSFDEAAALAPDGSRVDAATQRQIIERAQEAAAASSSLELRALSQQRGNELIEIVVEARSDRHFHDAGLRWVSDEATVLFGCSVLAEQQDPDASCVRQGNVFTFRIRAGTGHRKVRAMVLDGRDLWLMSSEAQLTLLP